MAGTISTSLAPWLTVRDGERAVAFYKSAFDAVETYRLEIPGGGGLVVKLTIGAAEFWISDGAPQGTAGEPESVGGGTVRLILTVADPERVFAKAVAAGASTVYPVGEQHGWRLGRLIDPVGLHWEIGHQLDTTHHA